MGAFPLHVCVKCLYLWRRLCNCVADEKEICRTARAGAPYIITQSSPGPLPVNASVIIGYRIAGVLGSAVAVLGSILPPMVIISVISVFYNQFRTNPYIACALQVMRAGVAAVIIDVVINLAKNVCKTRRVLYIAMMCVAFVCTYLLGVSAMIVIFTCLAIGIADLLIAMRKEKKKCHCY